MTTEWFRNRAEATAIIETWRTHESEVRPHSSLGYLAPHELKRQSDKDWFNNRRLGGTSQRTSGPKNPGRSRRLDFRERGSLRLNIKPALQRPRADAELVRRGGDASAVAQARAPERHSFGDAGRLFFTPITTPPSSMPAGATVAVATMNSQWKTSAGDNRTGPISGRYS